MAPKKKDNFFDFPRPCDNQNLVGHTAVVNAFTDAWKSRDNYPIHPVWMLTGPKGIGKATLAYKLAQHIFSDLTGRSEEEIAQQISVGGIGDLHIVDIEHNLTDGKPVKSITIKTIWNMIDRMHMHSMAESWRVVIIDSMDELSDKAPNALLKVLEEPPAKTIFFLIAHSLDRVFPTIRSRSRIEKLRPLPPLELRSIAAKLLPDHEISNDMIKISGGSFGRIANLVATGADTLFDDAKRILTEQSNGSDYLTLAKRIAKNPENISILLDVISHFGLAEEYGIAQAEIERMHIVNLEPESVAFKIITDIKKCL